MHYSNKLDSYYTVSWPKQTPYSPAQSTAQDKAPLNLWTLIQQKQTGFQVFFIIIRTEIHQLSDTKTTDC